MKAIFQFLAPTIKAGFGVLSVLFGVVAASYGGIIFIARSEAQSIERKINAVRQADMEHLNTRFDDTHKLLIEIRRDIRRIK